MSQSAYTRPIVAAAVESDVVLTGQGALAGSWTPEAVLESLEPMREAAEKAIVNRESVVVSLR